MRTEHEATCTAHPGLEMLRQGLGALVPRLLARQCSRGRRDMPVSRPCVRRRPRLALLLWIAAVLPLGCRSQSSIDASAIAALQDGALFAQVVEFAQLAERTRNIQSSVKAGFAARAYAASLAVTGSTEEAFRTAMQVPEDWRAKALCDAAENLILSGNSESARKFLAAAESEKKMDSVLTGEQLVRLWVKLGEVDKARRIMDSSDPKRRASIASAIGEALTETGRTQEAQQILAESERLALGLDWFDRDRCLSHVAVALAKLGNTGRASELAAKIGRDTDPCISCAVVEALAKDGKTQEALSTATQITSPHRRFEALVSAGRSQTQRGEPDAAQTFFTAARDLVQQADHVSEFAGPITGSVGPADRPPSLTDFVELLVKAQRIDDALSVAQRIPAKGHWSLTSAPAARARALAMVAGGLYGMGRAEAGVKLLAEARQLALGEGEVGKMSTLTEVAKVVGQSGWKEETQKTFDEAKKQALAETIPSLRISYFADLAEAALDFNDDSLALPLLDQATRFAKDHPVHDIEDCQIRGDLVATLARAGKYSESRVATDLCDGASGLYGAWRLSAHAAILLTYARKTNTTYGANQSGRSWPRPFI